jgi:hypothetical protein
VISLTEGTEEGRHLESCSSCRDKVNTLMAFAPVARRLAASSPHPEIVQRASALAARRSRVTVLTRLEAALHYHSTGLPLPAGLRGGSSTDRVVYHAEHFAVELRVSRTESRQVVVAGQISSLAQPARRLEMVPVVLLVGKRVAVRALSNAWGEFSFEADEQDDMWLEVAPAEGRSIRIPLRPRARTQTQGMDR